MNELKKLANELGGILVMNGNVPEFVVLSYGNYRKLENNKPIKPAGSISVDEEMIIDKLNREILTLKEEIRQKEEAELAEGGESDTEKTDEISEESQGIQGQI